MVTRPPGDESVAQRSVPGQHVPDPQPAHEHARPVEWLDRASWEASHETGRAGVDSDFGFTWGASRRIRVSFLPTTPYTYNRATESQTTGVLYAFDPTQDRYALLARDVTYGAVDTVGRQYGRRVLGGDPTEFAYLAAAIDGRRQGNAAGLPHDNGPPPAAMNSPERTAQDIYSPEVIEQLVRWSVPERMPRSIGTIPGGARDVIAAAKTGTRDQLRDELAAIAERRGRDLVGHDARHLRAALDGDLASLGFVLVHNEALLALSRTAAKRAMGIDMAEIATSDGLHVAVIAVDPGVSYEARVRVTDEMHPLLLDTDAMAEGRLWEYDAPTHRATLNATVVNAPSAHAALREAIRAERELGGLSRHDTRQLTTQLERAEALQHGGNTRSDAPQTDAVIADTADNAHPHAVDHGWAALVAELAGDEILTDPGWPGLAATLERAQTEGWDVQANLARLARHAPLPDRVCAELTYRVMDACEQAIPPAPSVGDINGPDVPSSGRARAETEQALHRTPGPTQRGHAIGR
jgi:hypothetical protein